MPEDQAAREAEAAAAAQAATDEAAAAAGEAAPSESPNIKQLREAYEKSKAELGTLQQQHEPYSKLGTAEEVAQRIQFATGLQERVVKLGVELNFTEEQILSSFRDNPEGTINFLLQAQEKATGEAGTEGALEKRLGNLEQQNQSRENLQKTEAANQRFDGEFDRLYNEDFSGDKALPDEAREAIYDIASESMKYDTEALTRLKMEGKVSDVARYFKEAVARFWRIQTAMEKKGTAGAGGGKPPAKPGTPKKATLDEMIEDPSKIDPKYAERV